MEKFKSASEVLGHFVKEKMEWDGGWSSANNVVQTRFWHSVRIISLTANHWIITLSLLNWGGNFCKPSPPDEHECTVITQQPQPIILFTCNGTDPAASRGYQSCALKLDAFLDLRQPSRRIKTHFSFLGDTNCQKSERLLQRCEPLGRGCTGG